MSVAGASAKLHRYLPSRGDFRLVHPAAEGAHQHAGSLGLGEGMSEVGIHGRVGREEVGILALDDEDDGAVPRVRA